MSPQETLAYKRELLTSNAQKISQTEIDRLGRHPARTKAELDRVFERLLQEYEAGRQRDRARFEEARKKEEKARKDAAGKESLPPGSS